MTLDVVATGSTGNCYILTAGNDKLLLDCGVRYKDIQAALGFKTKNVAGCLVGHDHGDHTKALNDVLRTGVDCYMTSGTAEAKEATGHRVHRVEAGQVFNVGNFGVYPFKTEHDAVDPVGYLISYRPTGEKLLYATDTFYLRYQFKNVNYILIECNYCQGIAKTRYTNGDIEKAFYDRLMTSHMSLDRCKEFLAASDLTATRHIVLIHMSEGNSDERRMMREINRQTNIPTTAAYGGLKIELNLHPF